LQSEAGINNWPFRILAAFRTSLILHALGVLAQAIFAGEFLSGIDAPVVFHEWTAWFILGVSALQIILSVIFTRLGGPLWIVIASVFVFIAEGLQTGTGYGRFLGVHIPLGVLVFGVLIWLLFWAFQKQVHPRDLPA
jgi:hypothetical protein